MSALKKHTDELAQQPRRIERATCPKCGGKITVKRMCGSRILEYHHDPAHFERGWCNGSDMNIDEDKTP